VDAGDGAGHSDGQSIPGWQRSPGWWFQRLGVPLLALIAIAGAIVWLQRPEQPTGRGSVSGDDAAEFGGQAPEEGLPAIDFTLSTLDGETVRLGDLQGKVVLLNFWATWCGPCREEMPLFEQAQKEFGADRLVILAVNVEEGVGTIRPFVERLALTYPIVMDQSGSVTRRYRVRSYPTTYFIGADGRIEGKRVGAYTRPILFGRLEQVLDER
jgi:cytochrome c biogenesis protein CcmG/thiol:disulfide interchange protein DsbE